jgi:hypothetical protein
MNEPTAVVLSMTYAEAVALREAVAFADFDGGMPNRDPAETAVISRLLRALDSLIPELGSDGYGSAVKTAWAEVNS